MNSIAIRTQLAAIARHLPGFSLDPEREYLIGAKGERLYLNGHNKRGMFNIGMGLPGSMDDFWSHYAHFRTNLTRLRDDFTLPPCPRLQ